MSVTDHTAPWLLMVFSLPAKRASQRVEIWRKLKRSGTLPLRSSGHILPNTPTNQERLEWLAGLIRSYKGEASVVHGTRAFCGVYALWRPELDAGCVLWSRCSGDWHHRAVSMEADKTHVEEGPPALGNLRHPGNHDGMDLARDCLAGCCRRLGNTCAPELPEASRGDRGLGRSVARSIPTSRCFPCGQWECVADLCLLCQGRIVRVWKRSRDCTVPLWRSSSGPSLAQ